MFSAQRDTGEAVMLRCGYANSTLSYMPNAEAARSAYWLWQVPRSSAATWRAVAGDRSLRAETL